MSLEALTLYTVTLIVAVASPGPAVAAIIGFVLGRGLLGAFAFIAGIIFGEFFWLAASIFGVEAVLNRFPALLLFMRIFGISYLLYMAYGLWRSAGASFTATTLKGGYRAAILRAA
jgi:threonine/homoserine/homoserine lactone efflux protein